MASPSYITESQSRLLLKTLSNCAKHIPNHSSTIAEVVKTPAWGKPFRKLEQIRKLFIHHGDDPSIAIEFSFNAELKKLLMQEAKSIQGLVQNKFHYSAYLTEKNIVKLVDLLKPRKFDIDPQIITYYDTIKSWNIETIKDQFKIDTISSPNFLKQITADLGLETAIDKNIIRDRSVRYQFFIPEPKSEATTLAESIANRDSVRVWVNKEEHSLADVFRSLVQLRRFPALIVFENQDEEKNYETLEKLDSALQQSNITSGVGVYFRMHNTECGKLFNQLIASKKYNTQLDANTKIAVVQSGKIPKFFLTNPWRPMSVIALDTHMGIRHGKTSVYAQQSDLIISYNKHSPINEKLDKWL